MLRIRPRKNLFTPILESDSAAYDEHQRTLVIELREALLQSIWHDLATVYGIPRRRWQKHSPLKRGTILTRAGSDAQSSVVFDQSTWAEFARLVPGARALSSRTANRLDVNAQVLRQRCVARSRILDLKRHRTALRRQRKAAPTAAARLAETEQYIDTVVRAEALGASDEGISFIGLPSYALMMRIERMLETTHGWQAIALLDTLENCPESLVEQANELIDSYLDIQLTLIRVLADHLCSARLLENLDDVFDLSLQELRILSRKELLGAGSEGDAKP